MEPQVASTHPALLLARAAPDTLLTGPLPQVSRAEMAHVIAARFLVGYSHHTRAAYGRDLADFFAWCGEHDVEVLDAGRSTIDAYARDLAEHPRAVTPRPAVPASPATVARRLAVLSGFYRYAMSEDIIRRSPVEHVRRPKVGNDSPTLGLDQDQAKRLLRTARDHSTRAHALVALLIHNGLRISEALGADIGDLDADRGHQLLWIRRKGGARHRVTLNPATSHAIETHLRDGDQDAEPRATGPIFATRNGNPLDRSEAWRLIRRLAAAAEIPSAERISPHSLRHTFVTLSREAGVPLEDVQDAAGHADPRTTRRYDRGRHSLERSPSYRLGSFLADDQ